ncbi:sulfatase family protein [Fibrisoma montanum]|nr:sulfatase-like hydrolase/transferase [Fibrisoma montanum]
MIRFLTLFLPLLWAAMSFLPYPESSSTSQPRPSRPNIVFILADDLGYGDLSCFGATDLRTPHIDSLIGSGIRFTNFYANSSVCSPSRAALLTGRYPEQVGVPGVIRDEVQDSWGYLASSATLLPTYLRKQGYHSANIGKWHLGLESPNLPNERGFQEFYGLLEGMMDDYVVKLRHGQNFLRHNGQVIDPPGHATDVFTDAAVRYLTERKAKKDPFFLYLAYTAPHDPLQPPIAYLNRVQKRQPGIDPQRAKLVALIEHMDDNVGRVLATLRANGQLNNTLVMFTSDNGGWGPGKANNGPFRGVKGQFYEGGIRIPTGAMWPGHIEAGSESGAVLQLMDWFPTLLQVAGSSVPDGISGQSFLNLMTGQGDATMSDRPLFFVRREGQDTYKGLQIHAVRQGDWKLLQPSPFAPYELYNLRNDPKETTNVADQNKNERDVLIKLLMEHIRQGGAVPWQKPQRQ